MSFIVDLGDEKNERDEARREALRREHFDAAADRIAAEHPEVTALIHDLEAAGCTPAIAGSMHAELRALALEEANPYEFPEPNDFDILIERHSFNVAAEVVERHKPADLVVLRDTELKFITGQGVPVSFRANRLMATIGQSQIDIVQPLTSIVIGGVAYGTSFSPRSIEGRHILGKSRLPFAPDNAVLRLYAVLSQRKEHDLERVGAIIDWPIPRGDNEPTLQELTGWGDRLSDDFIAAARARGAAAVRQAQQS